MRAFFLVLAYFVIATPTHAQQFTSPSDLVETLYNSYFSGLQIDDFDPYLSDDLTQQMSGKVGMSEFDALGFDPIVGVKDWAPRHFEIVPLEATLDKARITVRFESHGLPVSVTLTLIREPAHGWQIDHIAGVAGDRTWCTNTIIALKPATDIAP